MGSAFGDPVLAGRAFARWAVETLCVISAGGIVVGAKQFSFTGAARWVDQMLTPILLLQRAPFEQPV